MKKQFCNFFALIVCPLISFAQSSPGILSDGEIAKALITINENEIQAAQLAAVTATNNEVKEFAKNMAAQHAVNKKETEKVAKDNKVILKDSETSKFLKDEGKNAQTDLKSADRGRFDKRYIQQQVVMHEKALGTLNNTFIPSAEDAEFKAHLEKTRDAVAKHLEHARDLESRVQ